MIGAGCIAFGVFMLTALYRNTVTQGFIRPEDRS